MRLSRQEWPRLFISRKSYVTLSGTELTFWIGKEI